jgi:hypothetical protein
MPLWETPDGEVLSCIYCQQRAATTRDHVPPKFLFAEPRPNTLITVPACDVCNGSTIALDEEYFVGLLNWGDASQTPEGKRLWQTKLDRAYTRVRQDGTRMGLARVFAPAIRHIIVAGPDGGVEQRMAMAVDFPRVEKVIEKIVRGLYWFEYGEPIATPEVDVTTFLLAAYQDPPLEWELHKTRPGTRGWPGVFEYSLNRVARGRARAGALFRLRFYDTHYAVGVTHERSATDVDYPQIIATLLEARAATR